MRTTVEIKDEYRARLLEMAARRGEKGFSRIVNEAIELFLKQYRADEGRLKKALQLRGSLSRSEAELIRKETEAVRKFWR